MILKSSSLSTLIHEDAMMIQDDLVGSCMPISWPSKSGRKITSSNFLKTSVFSILKQGANLAKFMRNRDSTNLSLFLTERNREQTLATSLSYRLHFPTKILM